MNTCVFPYSSCFHHAVTWLRHSTAQQPPKDSGAAPAITRGFVVPISLKIKREKMALVSLGQRLADWTTKAPVVFNSVTIPKDRGLLLFLQQSPPAIDTTNQYLALAARLTTSYGIFQTPLEAKYFPTTDGIIFIVVIPDADYDRNVGVELLALPKEFKPGSRSSDALTLEAFYDDDLVRGIAAAIA